MANNLSVKIGANTADLEKSIDRAKKTLEQYSRAARQAKNQIENNVSVSNQQVNAYQRVVKQLEKVNSGTLSTTQQQKVLSNQVKELKIQWNALTDDQRISGWGQQIASSLKAAESELETTKQKLAAVNTETNKTSKGIDNVGKSSSKTGNVLGNLNGALGKVGLAFGAAEVATTLFNGALKQSDEFGDLVTNKMAGLTNVVYQLGAALATCDFSGVMNFYSWFSSGQAASQAQDNLDDIDQQVQYLLKHAQEAIAKAKETGLESDKNIANQKIKELSAYAKQLTNKAEKAAAADVGKALGSSKLNGIISTEIIDAAIKATPAQRQKAINKFKKVYAELQGKALSASNKARWSPKADELLRSYAQQGGLLTIVTGALWGTGSENRQKVIDELNKASDASRIVSRLYKQLNGTPDVKTPTVKTPRASTPKPKTELEEAKELFPLDKTIAKSLQSMQDYEDEKVKIMEEAAKKQAEIEEWWNERNEKADEEAAKRRLAAYKQQFDEEQKLREQQIKKQEEEEKGKQQLASATASLLSQTAQMVGQETAAGQALMAMSKMVIIAKEAEAIAKGVAEASSVPWPGNIAAIASIVASITSIFATLPTFADGGIFNGASKIGDYNVARVNDGEMILNGNQQANLFKMLNAPIANQQQSTSIASTKVRGQDIYISLKTFLKENPSKKL